MALQIRKPRTAFSLQPTGKKSGRIEDKDYLAWIRTLPCAVSGIFPVEAAHVSFPAPQYGKLGRGMSRKETDYWALPLSADQHRAQHSMGERKYWELIGVDPCVVALALRAAYHDDDEERARMVLEHSMRQAQANRRKG